MLQNLAILRKLAPLKRNRQFFRCSSVTTSKPQGEVAHSDSTADGDKKSPVKFTTSEAYIDYKAVRNFYGDDRDLPPSHNYVLASSMIFGIVYLIYLRDDIEGGGGAELFKPLHETLPQIAIPLLQSAIAENKKFGQDTRKLEKKLAELMQEPEKHGIPRQVLKEN